MHRYFEAIWESPWRRYVVLAVAFGFDVLGTAKNTAYADESPRSILVSGVTPERAALIAAHAEETRLAIFARLLDTPAPPVWVPRCVIHVHDDAASFTAAVGAPPVAARGATSIEFVGDRASLRRIDVMGDRGATIPDSLDHELVHVVLADHFTAAPPPRWADEGLAMLFDSVEKQLGHDADFETAVAHGQAWRTRDLMTIDPHPADTARLRIFYGQSAALVRWLIAREGAATFIAFLDDADRMGPGRALAARYGIESPEELDRRRVSVPPVAWHAASVRAP